MIGNFTEGLAADELRGGPFDKCGAGSRILDVKGHVVEAQLARLDEFALNKTDASGVIERGLGERELRPRRGFDKLSPNGTEAQPEWR